MVDLIKECDLMESEETFIDIEKIQEAAMKFSVRREERPFIEKFV